MSMAWIKMRVSLAEDPDVIAIANKLNADVLQVVGMLFVVWSWADAHLTDGRAFGVTYKWIDAKVRCDGFAAAMESVGWMTATNEGISLPNFERHNGTSAKKRAENTKRQTRSRKKRDTCATEVPQERDQRREEKIIYPPPRTPSHSSSDAVLIAAWVEVEEELLGMGIATARLAAKSARDNQCTPQQVRDLVAYWSSKQPAWDLGALAVRITTLRPGQDLTALWPAASKAKQLEDRDRYYEDQRRKRAEEEAERAASEREYQERFAKLDAKYGAKLDAMTKKQIRAFTTNACGNSASFLLRSWGSTGAPRGDHRYALLEALEQEAACAPEGSSVDETTPPLPQIEVARTGQPLGVQPEAVGDGVEF